MDIENDREVDAQKEDDTQLYNYIVTSNMSTVEARTSLERYISTKHPSQSPTGSALDKEPAY